jgi:hypothetical protein
MWRPYDWPDAAAIENAFRDKPFWVEPREVECPIDHTATVRSYYQRISATKSARYRWCPTCRHCSGQTGAVPPPPDFAEPVTVGDDLSLPKLMDELDRKWNAGVLPQTFMT